MSLDPIAIVVVIAALRWGWRRSVVRGRRDCNDVFFY
jgi:hypothetical protein